MSEKITRRTFLSAAAWAGAALASPGLVACGKPKTAGKPPRIVIISIDSLDPRYLALDQNGMPGGRPGNRLMPKVHEFLEGGATLAGARCFLPAATDANHLNALAGTHPGMTGVLGVSVQPAGFGPDGRMAVFPTSLSWARTADGKPVDTLLAAYGRRYGKSAKVLAVSGKDWVGRMLNAPGSGLSALVVGKDHPSYVPAPRPYSFYDPPGDENADTDKESIYQKLFSHIAYEGRPERFPCDEWIKDAALAVITREKPELAFVIFAQMDDLSHGLGCAYPEDFVPGEGGGVCRFNPMVYREPALDGVRDVDRRFGEFMVRLTAMPEYRDAVYVLYSDHGHVTHRSTLVTPLLRPSGTDFTKVLKSARVVSKKEAKGIGLGAYSATSLGFLYFPEKNAEARAARGKEAREALEAHRVVDPETRGLECPWQAVDRPGMIAGVPGVCPPGELFHPYLAEGGHAGLPPWPDVFLFARNGWQLPLTQGLATNLGAKVPWYVPDGEVFLGGHGSPDTSKILIAFRGPGIARGKILPDPDGKQNHTIADIAPTVCGLTGLSLETPVVGQDRSRQLA
ncbi:MAG: alkaline phosphatase family protein [Thermodesulfobacteriota bacterium]